MLQRLLCGRVEEEGRLAMAVVVVFGAVQKRYHAAGCDVTPRLVGLQLSRAALACYADLLSKTV